MERAGEEGRWERWLAGLRRVLALSREQGQAFLAQDYARVDELLFQRGQLLATLEDVRDIFSTADPPGEEYWQEAQGLLREISRLDNENREAIRSYLTDLRRDLAELDKWRRAARAYGGGEDIPARGVDV